MNHHIFKLASGMILILGFASCSGSEESLSIIDGITDAVKGIVSPDAAVNLAEKQISEIQSNLNKDKVYALTQDDVAFLKTEGLPVNENEIKSWVK